MLQVLYTVHNHVCVHGSDWKSVDWNDSKQIPYSYRTMIVHQKEQLHDDEQNFLFCGMMYTCESHDKLLCSTCYRSAKVRLHSYCNYNGSKFYCVYHDKEDECCFKQHAGGVKFQWRVASVYQGIIDRFNRKTRHITDVEE